MSEPKAVVELAAADLHGPGVVFCPNPKMSLWSNHPKVFIDVASTGEGTRPKPCILSTSVPARAALQWSGEDTWINTS